MKHILFTLSMPNVNSWNGQWSGYGNIYCKSRSYKNDSEKLISVLSDNNHYYNFGDGWGASVSIREVEISERNRIMKKSVGFAGYDWMIDEIERFGRILSLSERQAMSRAQ